MKASYNILKTLLEMAKENLPKTESPHLLVNALGETESPIQSFLSGVISVVGPENPSLCHDCREGSSSFSECLTCRVLLCDSCVKPHLRGRECSETRINKISISSAGSSQVLGPENPSLCHDCREGSSSFSECLTCRVLLCDSCVKPHLRGRECSVTRINKISISSAGSSQVVGTEIPSLCHHCGQGSSSFSECLACRVLLCDNCVRPHLRGRECTTNRINRLSTSSTSSSQMGYVSPPPPDLCVNHHEYNRYLCEDCEMSLCPECTFSNHIDHKMWPIDSFFEKTRAMNLELRGESRNAICLIDQAMDSVRKICTRLDMKSLDSITSVQNCIRRCRWELGNRETVLLQLISETRRIKDGNLMTQLKNLEIIFDRLSNSELHKESVSYKNLYELMVVKNKLENEVKYIRTLNSMLLPCEDSNIIFVPPDKRICFALSSIGRVVTGIQTQWSVLSLTSNQPHREVNIEDAFLHTRHLNTYNMNRVAAQLLSLSNGEMQVVPTDDKLCRPWDVCCEKMDKFFKADGSNTTQLISTSPTSSKCESNQGAYQVFCQTCIFPICTDCKILRHNEHQIISLTELVETTKKTQENLYEEFRDGIEMIQKAIGNIHKMSTNVGSRLIKVVNKVNTFMQRCTLDLQKRELELIKLIKHSRQIKYKHLMTQMENLQVVLEKFLRASVIQKHSVESNVHELIAMNKELVMQLQPFRTVRPALQPCDDDNIIFLPPDEDLFQTISLIGCILRGSTPTQNEIFDNIDIENLFPPIRNRCIYSANTIMVRSNRTLPILCFGDKAVSEESDDGKLLRPWGICCDSLGNFFVTDRCKNNIQVYSPEGKFLYKFGSSGSDPGQFNRPTGIAINPKGHLVIADKDNHRVQVLKIDGTVILTFGEMGHRHGQFHYPWDVACNALGNIVVTDARNQRIQLFAEDGMFLRKFGSSSTSEFDSPRGVCFHPKGDIIVTDFNTHRLAIVDPYLLTIQYVGGEGFSPGRLQRPQGIVCDDNGDICIVDSKNNRIQLWTIEGESLNFGTSGKLIGELDRPTDICLNPQGRVAVVDFQNLRVQVF